MLINIFYEAAPAAIASLLLSCKDCNIIFLTIPPSPLPNNILTDTIYLHVINDINIENIKNLIQLYHPYYNNNDNYKDISECNLSCNNVLLPLDKSWLEKQFNKFEVLKFRKILEKYINCYKKLFLVCLF